MRFLLEPVNKTSLKSLTGKLREIAKTKISRSETTCEIGNGGWVQDGTNDWSEHLKKKKARNESLMNFIFIENYMCFEVWKNDPHEQVNLY